MSSPSIDLPSGPVVPKTGMANILQAAEKIECDLRALLDLGKVEPETSNVLFLVHEHAFDLVDRLREHKDFTLSMAKYLLGCAKDLRASVEVAILPGEEDDDEYMEHEEDQVSVGEWTEDTYPMLRGLKNRAIDCVAQAVTVGLAAGLNESQLAAAFRFPFILKGREALPDASDALGPLLRAVFAFAHEGKFDAQEPLDMEMTTLRDEGKERLLARLKDNIGLGYPVVEFTPPDAPSGPPQAFEG